MLKLLMITAWSIIRVQAGCPFWMIFNQTLSTQVPGDGGYQILISGDYDKYIPNAVYTISLQGSNIYKSIKKFSRFALSVDSENVLFNRTGRMGFFQIFPESHIQFNEDCVNTVSEMSKYPKSEVQVMWRAPPAGSGCIVFTAIVMENLYHWFAREGKLTKTFCEMSAKETERLNDLHCCACDEAKYKMVLQGLWSKVTHPKDFPESVWLTHFSDVVGASHKTNFSFWGEDHIATDGFRQLAEWGSVSGLEGELRANARYLKTYIKASGLWYPNVNNKTSATFSVDHTHPLLSVASMLGPSPDWIVGVSKLNLCQRNCSWIKNIEVNLYPWDAGTDNGISYLSHNSETQPREYMKRITTMYPEDPRSPFYDLSGKPMEPVAKLYINIEEIKKASCDSNKVNNLVVEFNTTNTIDQNETPECMTTEYSEWSTCSVTCGKGLRMRTRAYRIPEKAVMMGCSQQLVTKEMCLGSNGECLNTQRENLSFSSIIEIGCTTSEWSSWSKCDPMCHINYKIRRRKLLNIQKRKNCLHITLVEKIKCEECDEFINKMESCKISEWSDWSPCSSSCRSGIQTRTRILLNVFQNKYRCIDKVKLLDKRLCHNKRDCNLNSSAKKVVCMEKVFKGPCRGHFEKWYFDSKHNVCLPFSYGGCRGNRNNFSSYEECKKICNDVS